jgi:O-antigen ligase
MMIVHRRLCGTGVFGDPNDLCEYVAMAMTLGLGLLLDRRGGLLRFLWVAPLGLLGYTITLTNSRGGLLAGVAGLVAQALFRLRGSRAILVAGLLAALALAVLGGPRAISFDSGTGKSRLEMWTESIALVRASPLLGVGPRQFVTYAGHVAHNALVEAYADLGVVGGTFLFGAYFVGLRQLWRLGSTRYRPADPERARALPAVFAALVAYAVGEMSLTHPYNAVTVALLGLAAATVRVARPDPPPPEARFSAGLLARIAGAGLLLYGALVLFAKFKAHW